MHKDNILKCSNYLKFFIQYYSGQLFKMPLTREELWKALNIEVAENKKAMMGRLITEFYILNDLNQIPEVIKQVERNMLMSYVMGMYMCEPEQLESMSMYTESKENQYKLAYYIVQMLSEFENPSEIVDYLRPVLTRYIPYLQEEIDNLMRSYEIYYRLHSVNPEQYLSLQRESVSILGRELTQYEIGYLQLEKLIKETYYNKSRFQNVLLVTLANSVNKATEDSLSPISKQDYEIATGNSEITSLLTSILTSLAKGVATDMGSAIISYLDFRDTLKSFRYALNMHKGEAFYSRNGDGGVGFRGYSSLF